MPRAKKPPAKKQAAKKKTRGRRNSNVISVDFTDVDAGGAMPTPDGIYTVEVKSAEKDVSSNGNDMVVVRYKTNIGSTVWDRFMLMNQSLWVLRTALNCMGYDTPDGPFDFDPDDLVGEKLGIEVTNEEYEEKDQPRVTGYLTVDVAAEQLTTPEEEEEEEDPAPKRRSRKAAAAEEEEDDDDDDEEEEDDDDEEEEEEPKKKSRRKTPEKKKKPAKKKAVALRPGARVTFEDDDEEYGGVIENIDDGIATVVDDEEGEWEIPVEELTKA